METFPNEFLAHHVPLIFVAGINPPPQTVPTSPPQVHPEAPAEGQRARPSLPSIATDPFEILTANLRRALAPKRPFALWDSARGKGADWHAVLVDRNIQFPPRKARPPPGAPAARLHSPLSPLSPGSPLFPDGLIAPIWIRKHRELIPCIFILVLRLWEPPSLANPLGNGPTERPQGEAEEERRRDAELVKEIVERKKTTSERGMKLAVIMMTSRRMLDDPSLDPRLGALRRASGLDSRSSLFVLSPLGLPEVTQFVSSLRSELWDSALDYYREHSRRVRRKRGRPSVTASSSAYVASTTSPGSSPLSQQGWHARADYKLATFAEMRQETEVALKHYEDAWDDLSNMFGSTAVLPPRTKRWAEAKVLVDCINIKICKLYLYSGDSARALSRFHRHVSRFNDLCNGWGIGDSTFEFWSWLSKQYRLLGDLVDLACRNGFRLSAFLPPAPSNLVEPPMRLVAGKLVPVQPGVASVAATFGLQTATILQHAGFYYYESAVCAEERREKFLEAQAAEEIMRANAGESFTPSPALVHESKVKHAELVIELYTKAYEVFKKFSSNRMTLFLASRIARVHHEASDHLMALRFFERIAKTYRREHCDEVLEGVLVMAYESAVRAGAVGSAIRLTFEVLALGSRATEGEAGVGLETRERLISGLRGLMESVAPTEEESMPVVVDLTEDTSFVDAVAGFWTDNATIGDAVPFQVVVPAPLSVPEIGLTFDSVRLAFSNGATVTVGSSGGDATDLEAVELGDVVSGAATDASGNLTWRPDSARIFRGTITASEDTTVTLDTIVFAFGSNGWKFEVATRPNENGQPSWLREAGTDSALIPLESLAGRCSFQPKRLATKVGLVHEASAFVDEHFRLLVEVANEDDCEVDASLSARIAGPAGSDDTLALDASDLPAAAVLPETALGSVSVGGRLNKELFIDFSGTAGDRRLEIIVSCKPAGDINSPAQVEHTNLIAIPVTPPFLYDFETTYVRQLRPSRKLLNLEEPDPWADAAVATFTASVQAQGTDPLWLEALSLNLRGNERQLRLKSSSLPASGQCDLSLDSGELFVMSCQIEVATLHLDYPDLRPRLQVAWSRYPPSKEYPISQTLVPLELPIPPQTSLVVTARIPSHAQLHSPCNLSFSISNPTAAVLDLSLQVDSSDQWLFSGARRINRILLLPDASRSVTMRAVPTAVGEIDIPRVHVFERVRQYVDPEVRPEGAGDAAEGDESPPPPPPQMRELEVVQEFDVDRALPASDLEADDQHFRGPMKIIVLPV